MYFNTMFKYRDDWWLFTKVNAYKVKKDMKTDRQTYKFLDANDIETGPSVDRDISKINKLIN